MSPRVCEGCGATPEDAPTVYGKHAICGDCLTQAVHFYLTITTIRDGKLEEIFDLVRLMQRSNSVVAGFEMGEFS
tara:strand:- start:1371 stop:1595 length:225 start_codon:yes stop_codon:yes gene_type:complete